MDEDEFQDAPDSRYEPTLTQKRTKRINLDPTMHKSTGLDRTLIGAKTETELSTG